MKINIKTDPETLFLLFGIVRQAAFSTVSKRREGKARQSMHLELFQALSSRCVNYTANPTGKAMKISLRYHLMNELFDLAHNAIVYGNLPVFEANKIEILKNNLHKALL